MADSGSKKSRKRPYCANELPSKSRLIEDPPTPRLAPQSSPRHIMPYTPSSEVLKCLGLFLCQSCSKLKHLSPTEPINWLRNIDNYRLTYVYQGATFLNSGSVVFLYMLCRDLLPPEVDSMEELQASLFTCFYISCYIGDALHYPVTPFLVGSSKKTFWDRCLSYIKVMSAKMMRINEDRQIYSSTLAELKAVGRYDNICILVKKHLLVTTSTPVTLNKRTRIIFYLPYFTQPDRGQTKKDFFRRSVLKYRTAGCIVCCIHSVFLHALLKSRSGSDPSSKVFF